MDLDTLLDALSEQDRVRVTGFLEETRGAIESDSAVARSPLDAFFLILRDEIIDPKLRIGKALKSAKIRGNGYTTRFFEITGMAPKGYVDHHRVLLAQKILRHTSLFIYKVAFLVGFTNQTMLCRTYKRVLGYPPGDEVRLVDSEEEAEGLDPRVSTNSGEIDLEPARIDLNEFWERVKEMDRPRLKAYMVRHMRSIGVEHHRLLLEKAKHEGRRSKARGEELAHIAVDALNLVGFQQGEEFFDEKAIGYASIANACRVRYKLEEARRWFRVADRFLPKDRGERPLLFAQVDFLRALLLWWRRDMEGSLRLTESILPDIRRYASHELLARILLLRGDIFDQSGHPDRAVSPFLEAVSLARFIDDPYIVFIANFNLAFLYVRLPMTPEATAQLSKVKELYGLVEEQVPACHMMYLEGSVCSSNGDFQQAERLLLDAKRGFVDLDLEIDTALVLLDLSLIYLDLARPEKAFPMALSAIPYVSRISSHPEAIAALSMLQEAVLLQRIDAPIARSALDHLERIRKDPVAKHMMHS